MKNKTLLTIILLFLVCRTQLLAGVPQEPDPNINSRYTVESVRVSGLPESKISKKLNEDMQKMVGEKFSQTAAEELGKRLEKELSHYSVSTKVHKGDTPEHVQVVFETERIWWKKFDINKSKFVYHSKEGWNGVLNATIETHHNAFTFGFINTADELLERDAGLRLAYEHRKLGTDRLRLILDFHSLHEKFNPATEYALALNPQVPGIYRTRQDFAPALAVLPVPDLQISFGTSFQQFETQYPSTRTETAYAGTLGVRFRRTFRNDPSPWRHRIDAGYTLRSATHTLDSDYIYTRHALQADYTLSYGRNHFDLQVIAGKITGRAPLFERFSIGNSETLRGWNKFDVAPLGGSRVAYSSIGYRYRDFNVFYDVGAVWDSGLPARARHALGFGYNDKNGVFALLGFPVRLHDVVPVITFGIRF
jgi:hypothetical protein